MSSWRTKRITPDPKMQRPKTRAAAVRQIRAIFEATDWDASEQNVYLRSHGLATGGSDNLSDDDLRLILNDFEAAGMILYADEKQKEKQTERTIETVL